MGRGFTEQAILDMPLDKVDIYLRGVLRGDAYRRQTAFVDLVNAIGVSFSGKGFSDYVNSLEVKDGD